MININILEVFMAFCQNCGNEVSGNFCPNCGANTNSSPETLTPPFGSPRPAPYAGRTIVENVEVHGRYNAGHMVLAYPAILFIGIAIVLLVVALSSLASEPAESIGMMCGGAFTAIIGILFFLPALIGIFKKSPKGEGVKTFIAYIFKSILFFLAWILSAVCCVYIVGIILRAWRIGVAASRPLDKHYTVFIDGKKIGVERKVDHEYTTPFETHYIYEDADGILYRPPLYND